MKVSVLSHDLSGNCLGRAHVLANLLVARHEVEIVGPVAGTGVWRPLRDDTSVPYRTLPAGTGLRAAAAAVTGDVLYAVKPKGPSLGVALLASRPTRDRPTRRPVLADVDDWETAFFLDNPRWMARNLVRLRDPSNVYATWALERLARRVDAVTVSSSSLQARFGGTVIPHARDAAVLDPTRAPGGGGVRAAYGLTGRTVVLFLGSPRRHKGVGTTVAALDRLADPAVAFLVVGATGPLPVRDWLIGVPPQPFDRVAEFLAAADVVVLAQHATRVAGAQVPAKVVDAMAMGRPIVSSAVSDLPAILAGCGVLVPPGDPAALAAALRRLLADPVEAARLGRAARARFVRDFSYDAVRDRLEDVLAGALARA